MDANVAKIYYSPQGYWIGPAAIKKLAQAAKVSEDAAKKWLINQALWQIYLPAPKHIPCPKFDLSTLNALHQAGLLFLRRQPRAWSGSKLLILPDISKKLNRWPWKTLLWLRALQKIYKWGPLKWPQLLQVHPMGKHNKRLTGTLRFTRTRKSLKDLSAPLLSCISPNSVCFGALNSFFVHLSFLMLHEITVIAQCDSTNVLKLQLEQPWLLHAPFVPCQPFFFPNSSATSGRTASSI